MKLNIRTKLVVPLGILFVAITFILTTVFPELIKKYLTNTLEEKVGVMSRILSASVEDALINGQYTQLVGLMEKIKETRGISAIIVFDENREVLFSFPRETIFVKELITASENTLLERGSNLYKINLLEYKQKTIGYLVLGLDLSRRNRRISENRQYIILAGIILLFLSIAILLYICSRMTRPIRELLYVTKKVYAGDLSAKTEIVTGDEIGELSISFNKMIENLEKTTVARDLLAEEVSRRKQAEEQVNAANQQLDASNQQLKANEQSLKKSAEEWQATFNAITDGVSIQDRDCRLVKVNKAYADIFKMKQEDLIGKKCYGVVHGSKEPLSCCPHEKTMDTKQPSTIEYFEPKLKCYIEISTYPICDENGELMLSVHTVKDITQRKQTEKEIEESKEQAESANRAKSLFLSSMSHEIRTPMNAVLGFTDLLMDTPLNDIQLDYVKTTQESGKLFLTLINDILDMSKIEAGELQMEKIHFNLEYLINSIVNIVEPQIKNKDIKLYYDYGDNIPQDFQGDPTRIRQILLNLLGNAVKFTSEGEIKVNIEQEGLDNDTCIIQISIQDTGIGISEERQKVIFNPFTQAEGYTTRKYGGTGLGLTITKRLIEKMGGEIFLESKKGKGSKFSFNLRLKKGTPIVKQEILPATVMELGNKKVLIIDDNEINNRIMDACCKKENMIVLNKFSSAHDALNWLSSKSDSELPDIIFCDVMMPEMDGYEFSQEVRKNDRFRCIKLISITSEAIPGKAQKADESGFDAFLPKPIVRENFIKIVTTTLGDRRSRGQIITRHMAEELSLKGMKILSVEDNVINKKLTENILKKFGCEVESACNGQEAIEKIKKEKYDIVLMDMQMPVMGGIEATGIIRSDISQELSIIALTAGVMQEDVEKYFKSGVNDYLSKPINVQALKEKLLKWGK